MGRPHLHLPPRGLHLATRSEVSLPVDLVQAATPCADAELADPADTKVTLEELNRDIPCAPRAAVAVTTSRMRPGIPGVQAVLGCFLRCLVWFRAFLAPKEHSL